MVGGKYELLVLIFGFLLAFLVFRETRFPGRIGILGCLTVFLAFWVAGALGVFFIIRLTGYVIKGFFALIAFLFFFRESEKRRTFKKKGSPI